MDERYNLFIWSEKQLYKYFAVYHYDSILKVQSAENIPFGEESYLYLRNRQQIYLCDPQHQRIVLFNKDLRVVRVFYFPQNFQQRWDFPQDFIPNQMVINDKGEIYVWDIENQRLYKFDNFWNPLYEIPLELEETPSILAYDYTKDVVVLIDSTTKTFYWISDAGNVIMQQTFPSFEQVFFKNKRFWAVAGKHLYYKEMERFIPFFSFEHAIEHLALEGNRIAVADKTHLWIYHVGD